MGNNKQWYRVMLKSTVLLEVEADSPGNAITDALQVVQEESTLYKNVRAEVSCGIEDMINYRRIDKM